MSRTHLLLSTQDNKNQLKTSEEEIRKKIRLHKRGKEIPFDLISIVITQTTTM